MTLSADSDVAILRGIGGDDVGLDSWRHHPDITSPVDCDVTILPAAPVNMTNSMLGSVCTVSSNLFKDTFRRVYVSCTHLVLLIV